MRRISKRVSMGSGRRAIRLAIRNHMRLIAIAVVMSLLVTSLPATAGTKGVLDQQNRSNPPEISLPAQVYYSLSKTVASVSSWAMSFISRKPSNTSQPVAAYVVPAPPFIDAPTSLTVTATASNSISLSWNAPAGTVDHYLLERSENVNGPFLLVASVTGATTKNDTTVTNLHAYLYRIRAVSSTGAISTPSNMALGTAISFQFSSLLGQIIRAQHFSDVRTAINLVRAAGNVPAEVWDRSNLTNLPIMADDVNEMRTALDTGLSALYITPTPYTDPTLSVGANGTLIKAIHLEQLQTRSTRGMSTSSGPADSDSSTARLDPMNATGGDGENPLSRNFNWSLPLVNLPGRAGLDLNLTLSYNSLVWTKIGTTAISFDNDNGFPSAGFRLGLPAIQPNYYNAATGQNAFLLIGSDGSRKELRQVGSSVLYEAADSSHLLLHSDTMILNATDGTQFSYQLQGVEYHCTEVKDRNGNYITINYNGSGQIANIHDTLDRTITFVYDQGLLTSIEQSWKKPTNPSQSITHTWASFAYSNVTIQTNFAAGLAVTGPANGSTPKMLSKVTIDDNSTTPSQNSHYDFEYTSWGQVKKISNVAADNHVLNYRSYNLPDASSALSECPRFTERRDWAENWNRNASGVEQEAITSYSPLQSGNAIVPGKSSQAATFVQVTNPNGTSSKIYFLGTPGTDTGWQVGLKYLIDSYDCLDTNPINPCTNSSLVRQIETLWTQDDDTSTFVLNPRVAETNAYDASGNRRRTRMVYENFTFADTTSCYLPKFVHEYKSDASNYLRTTEYSYVSHTNYAPKRILGLVSDQRLRDGNENGAVVSWLSYGYDESGSIDGANTPIKHDGPNYGPTVIVGRGNLTSVTKHDVSTGTTSTSTRKYDRAGSIVSLKDPLNHEIKYAYADNFSDGNNSRQTFAYRKTVTDPDNFITTSSYNFDFGAVVTVQTPKPNVGTYQAGPVKTTNYDDLGRVERLTNSVNAAYTRYEYAQSGTRMDTFSNMKTGASQQNGNEGQAFAVYDGAGRMIASVTKRAAGGFNARRFEYDVMGRTVKTSNPAETTAIGSPLAWQTSGSDALTGWKFIEQTYDWKGRPRRWTNQDGTTRTAAYTGCGCAGGDVVTLTDEGTTVNGVNKRRQQTLHHDVVGRLVKTEVWDFEGTAPDGIGRRLDSTTVTTYNVRDQATLIRQYEGAEGSTNFRDTTMTYDGLGRLATSHEPHQQAGQNQSWTSDHTTFHYDAEDKLDYTIDARGVKKQLSYANNSRHLLTGISFDLSALPGGQTSVLPTTAATFEYDSVGRRKKMTDGTGTITYNYNDLAQLTSEARVFTEVPGQTYTLSYEYELGGQLKKVTDYNSATINYNYDSAGQLSEVTGEGTLIENVSNYASGFEYRAWGGLKGISFGNGISQQTNFNSRQQPTDASINGVAVLNSISFSYDYYDDGREKHAYNGYDNRFDRLLEYDHVGRFKAAYSGREARGLAPTSPYPDSPYQQSFQYDAFNNRTQKSGRFWRTPQTGNTPCVPRQQPDGCDSEGNVINNANDAKLYDAASKLINYKNWKYTVGGSPNHPDVEPSEEITQTYDADGRPTKRIATSRTEELIGSGPQTNIITSETSILFMYSTALGGAKLVELGGGNVSTTYVYANGIRIAKQNIQANSIYNSVTWNHVNPGSNSYVESLSNAQIFFEERDPDDAETGLEDPWANILEEEPTYKHIKDDEPLYLEGGNPFDFSAGLTIDGLPVTQAEFNRRMGNGSAGVEISIGGRPVAFVTNTQQLSHITVDIFRVDKELQGLPQSQRWGGTYYIGSMEIDLGIQQQQPSNPWGALHVPQVLVPFDTISIREWVMAILASPDCREFAKEILDALDKKRKGLGTLEEVADAFFAQKGDLFTRVKPSNSRGVGNPEGRISNGDAKIFSSGSHNTDQISQILKDVDTVIAELFHLAAKGQYYTDGELAKAVHNSKYASDANRIVGPQGQPLIAPTRNIFDEAYIKLDKVSKEDAYSNYFHAIQDKHCSTNPNRKSWFE